MKKSLILTAFLMFFAVSYAFSVTLVDVPSGHWAEDAVQKLVDSGLIEGYPDGSFKGDRPMTRYEYAMVVARMMDKIGSMTPEAKAADCADCLKTGDLDELKGIVEKLAAEFKDELAALKVKVDENSTRIGAIEKKIDDALGFNIAINGNVRQRIDVPNSDMTPFNLSYYYLGLLYDPADSNNQATTCFAGRTCSYVVDTGYELKSDIVLTGESGKDKRVDFSIGLQQEFNNVTPVGSYTAADDALDIEHAYVNLNFSNDVKELNGLTVRAGYQYINYGPYGLLIDTNGNDAMPGLTLGIGKDRVKLSGSGLMVQANSNNGLPVTNSVAIGAGSSGLGSTGKDLYYTGRLDIDLDEVRLGVNYLGNGVLKETGWGADIDADLLRFSNFLKGLRAEYMTITDTTAGVAPGNNVDDYSFMVGLDVYETKRTAITVSYADFPAASVMTGMDANPFTEYDNLCSLGLDVGGVGGTCLTYDSGRVLFPMGFKGLGLEASHIVLGDVKFAAKAIFGDFAGGSLDYNHDGTIDNTDIEGLDYPGYGALSITKPINDESAFRVEYMRQGLDTIIMDRVRSELVISF